MADRHPDLGPEQEWPMDHLIEPMKIEPPERNPTRLATAIKLFLASRDMDQKSFSANVDTNQSTVTRFLRGECTPEAKTLLRMVAWMMESDG